MPLTTLPVVKSLLGITVSTYDVPLQMLIDGVCEQVIRYCARNFNATNVIFKNELDHDPEIVLDETPVNSIMYFGTGSGCAIGLVCSGANAQASVRSTAGAGILSLTSDMVTTDIPIPVGTTLADLDTLITAVPTWSATVESGYDDYPANALLDQSSETVEAGTEFYLKAALSPRKLVRHEAEGIYVVKDGCGGRDGWEDEDWRYCHLPLPFVCIYNGGYATVPAGLTLIVNQICCDGWRNFNNNAAMKSESIGDYSYTKFDAAQIASSIGPYMSALDLYKRV